MSLIECNNLTIGYENKEISNNINFCINKGDYISVLGENGAGKSTLIKTILGLIKPLDGNIKYSSQDLKKNIGYLPQQTISQANFPATVLEIVMSGFVSKDKKFFYSKEQKSKALEMIEKLYLSEFINTSFKNLSGGQKQRVLLARSLCATKDLIILDEPVTSLDPKVTQFFYETLKKINDEGITILMISHDLDKSLEYSSHILYIGKENSFETKENFVKSKNYKYLIGENND